MTSDPLEEVLELENTFYKEGYDLGVQDGSRTGRIEGRIFGLEKGFEKYALMGKLHGRSVVWSGRLSSPHQSPQINVLDYATEALPTNPASEQSQGAASVPIEDLSSLPRIPPNPRLEKHIRTLYALTEPASLSTINNEDAVSDFDDRFRRAEGKVKIIEKLVGEETTNDGMVDAGGGLEAGFTGGGNQQGPARGDGGIEDISVLQTRH